MRLTPAQLYMSLIVRGSLPRLEREYDSLAEGITRGRQGLIRTTGQDFAYDLLAWHQYLIDTNAGGYKWGNGYRRYLSEIEIALADETWQQAVAASIAASLLERLNERDSNQRDAVESAQRDWGGKNRACPKCSTEFTSVGDRGHCPQCGQIFYASHPTLGNVMWWLQI